MSDDDRIEAAAIDAAEEAAATDEPPRAGDTALAIERRSAQGIRGASGFPWWALAQCARDEVEALRNGKPACDLCGMAARLVEADSIAYAAGRIEMWSAWRLVAAAELAHLRAGPCAFCGGMGR